MTITTALYIPGVTVAAPRYNVFGVPAMPVLPRFLHRAKTGFDFTGINRGRLVEGQVTGSAEPVVEGDFDFETDPKSVRMTGRDGLRTPYQMPASFTWLYVGRNVTQNVRTFISQRDEAVGTSWYSAGTGAYIDAKLRIPYYDGDAGDATNMDIQLTDALHTLDEWRMIAATFDATSGVATIYALSAPVAAASVTDTIPAGNVRDDRRDDELLIVLGGDNTGDGPAPSIKADVALWAGWDEALSEAQLRNAVYPALKAWLTADGVAVV